MNTICGDMFQAHSAYSIVDGIRVDELNNESSSEAREIFASIINT